MVGALVVGAKDGEAVDGAIVPSMGARVGLKVGEADGDSEAASGHTVLGGSPRKVCCIEIRETKFNIYISRSSPANEPVLTKTLHPCL